MRPAPGTLSPRQHRRIDRLALPGLVGAAVALARRDRRAAGVVGLVALGEGSAHLVTDYPPPVLLPVIGFRTHNRLGAFGGACLAGVGLRGPGLTPVGRATIVAIAMVPIALAVLSDTG